MRPPHCCPTPLQDNLYWLGLLTHLQADCVPLKSLDCLRDLRDMYEAAAVDDVYDAYQQVGAGFACLVLIVCGGHAFLLHCVRPIPPARS